MSNKYPSNIEKFVHEILLKHVGYEFGELSDKYGISDKELEGLAVSIFVKNTSKELWKGGRTKFVKAYVEEIILLVEEMAIDWADLGFLLYLSAKFTNYEDNTLRNEDGEYLSQKELIESISNLRNSKSSESTSKRKIKELEKRNLLFSKKHPDKNTKIFYLSPHLFYKGKFIDKNMKISLLKFAKSIDISDLNSLGSDDNEIINNILECLSHVA